jgi:putative NADH-flavin reductase
MAPKYASEQPSGYKNYVESIAIIGAGGNVGKFIADALISEKRHKVTAITRPDSNSALPSGLHDTKKAGYDDHAALVEALRGQEALVIIMSVFAPQDTQIKIASAAIEAGVTWIMPAEFGSDQVNENVRSIDWILC